MAVKKKTDPKPKPKPARSYAKLTSSRGGDLSKPSKGASGKIDPKAVAGRKALQKAEIEGRKTPIPHKMSHVEENRYSYIQSGKNSRGDKGKSTSQSYKQATINRKK